MKSVRHIGIIFFLVLGSQFVHGQEATESVKKIAKVGTERWKNTLILTTNQTQKLLNLKMAYEMEKSKIFNSDGLSADELNSKLSSLDDSHHKSVEAILNAKQIEKYRSKLKPIKGEYSLGY